MKRFALVIGLFLSGVAEANGYLDGYIQESKATTFLNKQKPCYFWMTFAPNDRRLGPDSVVPSMVLCFANMTIDEGTVNEFRGCGMSHYSLESNSYLAPTDRSKIEVEPGACTIEKVQTLMSRVPWAKKDLPPQINAISWIAVIAKMWNEQKFRFGGTGPKEKIAADLAVHVCSDGAQQWSWWPQAVTAFNCAAFHDAQRTKAK